MNSGLLRRALRELAPATALLAPLLCAVGAVMAYVLPTYQQQFAAQIMQVPFVQNMIRAMTGLDIADAGAEMFSSIPWVHPVVLAVLWAHAIISCTRVPAGEVDRGTIDVLLSLPISRWRLYVNESAASIAMGMLVIAAACLGNLIGTLSLDPSLRPHAGRVCIVVLNVAALYLAVSGLACLFSACSDRRGKAMAGAFVIVLLGFLWNYLAPFWSIAERLSFLSLMHYHRPVFVLRDGTIPVGDFAVLIIAAAGLWTLGGIIFARRDLMTV